MEAKVILKTSVNLLTFGTFLHNQLPGPDLDLKDITQNNQTSP